MRLLKTNEVARAHLEAKICLSLFKGGKMSVREIAKESGVIRTDVYRVLNKMKENNLIIEHLGRPLIYEVLSPDSLLEVLVENQENKLRARLVKKQGEQRDSLNSMIKPHISLSDINEYFQFVRGVPNIVNKLREITDSTQSELRARAH